MAGVSNATPAFGILQLAGELSVPERELAAVDEPIGERFVTRGGNEYNYARTERLGEIPAPSSLG
jgi:hypothetical protein